MPDAREIIAVIVTVGSFGLLGGFIFTGGHLDSGTGVGLVTFSSGALGAVLGFYFGKTNGAQTQLATSTADLAAQAMSMVVARRAGEVVVSGPATVTAVGASSPAASPPPAMG